MQILRSGVCTQTGYCLPLRLWDLGFIEVKIGEITRKCRSAAGGKLSLLSPLSQCGRISSSFFTDASNFKFTDVSDLGYFRN